LIDISILGDFQLDLSTINHLLEVEIWIGASIGEEAIVAEYTAVNKTIKINFDID
jgi:hypothetical protein